MKEATELEFLKWFYSQLDFGPAHSDVIVGMQAQFEREQKKKVPHEYRYIE